MRESANKPKRSSKISTRPIISLLIGLGCLSAVFLVTMFASQGGQSSSNHNANNTDQQEQGIAAQEGVGNLVVGVVKSIDTEKEQIALYDINKEETTLYSYSGGTNITDQYGKQMSVGQLELAVMVEATYQPKNNRLTKISISKDAWEYVGVNNFNIDRSAKIMQLATRKYKYTEDLLVLDGEDYIPIANLTEQDELTVRGYDQTIWSITVTRGHGTVRLADYANFLGASVTIGYEAMQQIVEDTIITVREGNFNLTVENGRYTATKNITILRNEETIVSLADMGPEAEKQSRVIFEITPFGAELFIDGQLMSYARSIELSYGDHTIEVSLDGYTSYEGNLTIDTAGKSLRIDLPKKSSQEEATVTETDTSDNQAEDTNSSTDSDTQTEEPDTSDNSNSDAQADTNDNANGDNDTDSDTGNEDEEQIIDEDHLIYIQNPLGASVYLDGDFMGISPGSFKKMIGSHVLTFIKEGYVTMSYTVDILNDNLDTYLNMPDLVKE